MSILRLLHMASW